ncbi:MAG: elongation factor 4 [Planctomycetes bacterium]|nr:elongation factor 4 [Planctomycetota bacterium]
MLREPRVGVRAALRVGPRLRGVAVSRFRAGLRRRHAGKEDAGRGGDLYNLSHVVAWRVAKLRTPRSQFSHATALRTQCFPRARLSVNWLPQFPQTPLADSSIRNFCIIAHIDHGKSTLADRFLELTGTIEKRDMREQTLDGMDLERERGITIKAKAVMMQYKQSGVDYKLNMIDTPGHVDFAYEVMKSLQACEGALLLVDSSQGVEAQTVANAHLAVNAGLTIIPVQNKIDLPHSHPDEVDLEIENSLALPKEDCVRISAKTGQNVEELLRTIIAKIPPPTGDPDKPLRALIFDSVYDDYVGVIVYVRVIDGRIKKRDKIIMLGTNRTHEVIEIGVFKPKRTPGEMLEAGEVGYIISGIRRLQDVKIGDTVTSDKGERAASLPGYVEPKPMVFCGLYPTNHSDYESLREALDKLALNDASFTYEPETSEALGFGFRCGFLGLLHMDVVQERIERESGIDIITTAPSVGYEVLLNSGKSVRVRSAAEVPDPSTFSEFREPIVRLSLLIPSEAIGPLMTLCVERRGEYVKTDYLSPTRALLVFDMPLAEILFDFYDKLKSATRGYGTMDYELHGYRAADLVKCKILVGGQEVDALSTIVERTQAERRGRAVLLKLRKEIPRHLFEVVLQAAIGGKIIARESIRPLMKNVIAKCYGGDISRKRKLLEKQKEGKKRMKSVGNVEIPQQAFLAVLQTDDE